MAGRNESACPTPHRASLKTLPIVPPEGIKGRKTKNLSFERCPLFYHTGFGIAVVGKF
jgi:hypothetical protein